MDRPIKKSHTPVHCVSHTDCWAESRINEVCAVSVYIPHRYMIGIWCVASSAKGITHTAKNTRTHMQTHSVNIK